MGRRSGLFRVFGRAAFAAQVLSVVACGADLPGDFADASQPIINGTFTPTLVSLSSGQQLAIGYLSRGNGEPFCTASLIANDVAITAEHCLKDKALADLRFGLGSASAPRARFQLRRAALGGWERDTALIQLTQNVVAAVPEVEPLVLQRTTLSASLIGGSAEASGYHLISGQEPRRRFGVLGVTNLLDSAIVANGFGARGVCHGDSGGPLLAELSAGRTTLIGITLGGSQSCRDESYFTRVDAILLWLDGELRTFAQSPSPTGSSGGSTGRTGPSCADADNHGMWPIAGVLFVIAPRRRKSRRTLRER